MTIYDFPETDILIDDYCTRKEAEKYLKDGAIVYDPTDFINDWLLSSDLDDDETQDFLKRAGCETTDQFIKKANAGQLPPLDCISNGIYKDCPYIIVYCL